MTKELIEQSRKRREFGNVALFIIAIVLTVSLAVAAIAVSIGIARADTLGSIAGSGGEQLALAVFLALVIAGMGGLTAVMVGDGERPLRRD